MDWIEECVGYCKRIKYLAEEIEWSEKPNKSGWLRATSLLLDDSFESIPGLSFQGEFQPRRKGDVYSFALMFTKEAQSRRVFMLEVYPRHVRSHMEDGVELFGSHIHLGDHRVEQVVKDVRGAVETLPIERWIRRFKAHVNLRDRDRFALKPPFADSMFH